MILEKDGLSVIVKQYNGADWFCLHNIGTGIGFRNPIDAIIRYVSIENCWHKGFSCSEDLTGYGNEDAVWELIYAPTVKAETKRKMADFFRYVLSELEDRRKPAVVPQIFQSEFGQVRAVEVEGEPWFVAKDVCDCLGYKNSRAAVKTHVDDDEKGCNYFDTLGGRQKLTVVNESGLYALVFGSEIKDARKFRRWVTSEVLPSIRRTGAYEVQSQAKAIQLIMQKFDALEAKLLEDKPKVKFYDDMQAAVGSVRMDMLANVLAKNGVTRDNGKPIGRDSLYKRLREEGYLTKDKVPDGYGNKRYENRPTQMAIERNLFERIPSHNHGVLSYTVYVTPKGIEYFNRIF